MPRKEMTWAEWTAIPSWRRTEPEGGCRYVMEQDPETGATVLTPVEIIWPTQFGRNP